MKLAIHNTLLTKYSQTGTKPTISQKNKTDIGLVGI
jgi:hypothetical protein